jgi:hypothetical protein
MEDLDVLWPEGRAFEKSGQKCSDGSLVMKFPGGAARVVGDADRSRASTVKRRRPAESPGDR